MNDGKVFESNWRKSMPDNVYFQRIKDSPASFGMDSNAVRFSLNNPYDSFIFYGGNLFTFELKSTIGTSISIQRNKTEKGKMIKLNQITGLLESSKHNGIFSGFIIDFRDSGNTYFLNIVDFKRFVDSTDKKSINEKDVVNLGGLLVEKKKKKIHYTYDVLGLLESIKTKSGLLFID